MMNRGSRHSSGTREPYWCDKRRHKRARTGHWVQLAAAVCFLWGQCALALDPTLDVSQYAHTAWTTRDAFFKSPAVAIAQTPDGYLWLGTKMGLLRFDGVRSNPWTPPDGEHLPSSSVVSLVAARDGTLWVGTDAGIASWDGKELKRYHELDQQRILTLLEDREGTVWIGGQSDPASLLCAVRTGRMRCWGQDGALGRSVFSLYEDSKGCLWVGSASGLWRWNPGPEKVYVLPRTVPPLQLNDLNEGGDGRLLIAMRGGVMQFTNGQAEHYSLPDGPKPYSARRLLRDRSGSLWIGTIDRGLLHVHHGRTDVFSRSDGLSGEIVQNMLEDREGNVWVVTNGGIDRFREYAVSNISSQQGLSTDAGGSVLAAGDGNVWIGTFHDLNRWDHGKVTVFDKRNGLPDNKPQAQYEDYRGRIWVFTSRGLALFENGKFTQIKGVPGGDVRSIAGDRAENLWLAEDRSLLHLRSMKLVEQISWSQFGQKLPANELIIDQEHGGLWLGFGASDRVAYFKEGKIHSSYTAADGLGKGTVTSLHLDKHGALWAATQSGLSIIKDGRIVTLTSNDGLGCDAVDWAIEDDNGSAWLQMPCGLLRIQAAELDAWLVDKSQKIHPTVFDGADGFFPRADPLATYSPRVSKGPDGKLWFLSSGGVSAIDPNHLPFNNLPPPVYIERVVADDRSHNVSNAMHLPPRVHSVTIDYAALSLAVPEKVRFRIKLEGLDYEWQDVGTRRQAFYTNLPPRNYRFLVMACNNSGVWNKQGASMDFTIDPAYYQTSWFRALCVAAFLALLWAAYLMRVRHLQQHERKLRDVVETIPTIAWTALPDGWVDFSNHHWEEYTGLSIEKGSGSGWEAAVHPDDVKRHAEKWRASVASGELFENEARYRRVDGEYRWFLVRAVPLRDRGGKIRKWYGTKTDIEDRKRAEQLQTELAHMNRVTTLGELAASISHELKQPITAAMTNANTGLRWLKRAQPDVEEASEAIKRVVKDGARAADIIDRLRSLCKNSPPERESLDLNEIIREMVVLLRGEANRCAISIRSDVSANLPRTMADRVQVQQVLMNIMLNGIESMSETGGVLTVKSQISRDGQVLVSISDTGIGLPTGKADQIFSAFFTTKPQGSGMGLAISRSIIESHRGRLWATANDGRGATFHFTLPVAVEEVKAPAGGS